MSFIRSQFDGFIINVQCYVAQSCRLDRGGSTVSGSLSTFIVQVGLVNPVNQRVVDNGRFEKDLSLFQHLFGLNIVMMALLELCYLNLSTQMVAVLDGHPPVALRGTKRSYRSVEICGRLVVAASSGIKNLSGLLGLSLEAGQIRLRVLTVSISCRR